MADYRTKREKLEAMASQAVSPNEAAIARAKLAEMRNPTHSDSDPITPEMIKAAYEDVMRWTRVPPQWFARFQVSGHYPDDMSGHYPDPPVGRKTRPI